MKKYWYKVIHFFNVRKIALKEAYRSYKLITTPTVKQVSNFLSLDKNKNKQYYSAYYDFMYDWRLRTKQMIESERLKMTQIGIDYDNIDNKNKHNTGETK